MSNTDLIRKDGSDTYYREQPDGKVLREALAYAMYSNPLRGYLGLEARTRTRAFGQNRPGWEDGPNPLRKVQQVEGLEHWRYEVLEQDAAAMKPMLADFDITDERADWLTDIFLWTPMTLIREKVRDFLEDTDPGMNLLFPTRVFHKTSGKEVPEKFYSWLPKRRLFRSRDHVVDKSIKIRSPFPGSLGTDNIAIEMATNQSLRALAQTLPSFGFYFDSPTVFNAKMFTALKAEKFTGMVERPDTGTEHMGFLADDDPNWNVGHFH